MEGILMGRTIATSRHVCTSEQTMQQSSVIVLSCHQFLAQASKNHNLNLWSHTPSMLVCLNFSRKVSENQQSWWLIYFPWNVLSLFAWDSIEVREILHSFILICIGKLLILWTTVYVSIFWMFFFYLNDINLHFVQDSKLHFSRMKV